MVEYGIYGDNSFELQIRTVVQDSWSIIDHKIKYKKSIPSALKRRINTLAALFELADREFRAVRDATLAEIEKSTDLYQTIEQETAVVESEEATNANEQQEIAPRQYAPLNAFNFLRIAQHFFPHFEFEPHKVDGLTQEISSTKEGISRGKFNFYMKANIGDVKRYKEDFEGTGELMNPYTVIRHCLYAGDNQAFQPILTDTARERFDAWIVAKKGGQGTVS